MNCIMIVLLKFYSSIIVLKQKGMRLVMKNPLSLRLLPGCRWRSLKLARVLLQRNQSLYVIWGYENFCIL